MRTTRNQWAPVAGHAGGVQGDPAVRAALFRYPTGCLVMRQVRRQRYSTFHVQFLVRRDPGNRTLPQLPAWPPQPGPKPLRDTLPRHHHRSPDSRATGTRHPRNRRNRFPGRMISPSPRSRGTFTTCRGTVRECRCPGPLRAHPVSPWSAPPAARPHPDQSHAGATAGTARRQPTIGPRGPEPRAHHPSSPPTSPTSGPGSRQPWMSAETPRRPHRFPVQPRVPVRPRPVHERHDRGSACIPAPGRHRHRTHRNGPGRRRGGEAACTPHEQGAPRRQPSSGRHAWIAATLPE